MKYPILLISLFLVFSFNSTYCQKKSKEKVVSYLIGDSTDVSTKTEAGLLLMGGSTDVDSAMKWFLSKSGGGDILVLRASGADGYNKYMFDLAKVNSVETLIIDSREKASLPEIEEKIRNAEAVFIAGGDQWNYVKYWKNTGVASAINHLLNTKKVPVGGTSAGLAILGQAYFSAEFDTITSDEVLTNPLSNKVAIGSKDFIASKFLENTITDSHYSQRDRQGRHIVFMAKMMQSLDYKIVKGIGIDEKTAVCIDQNGIGKVFGANSAYFLQTNNKLPEEFSSQKPLTWLRNKKAIKAYKITGSPTGNGSFKANNWTFKGGIQYFYYVKEGKLFQN